MRCFRFRSSLVSHFFSRSFAARGFSFRHPATREKKPLVPGVTRRERTVRLTKKAEAETNNSKLLEWQHQTNLMEMWTDCRVSEFDFTSL